MLNLLEASWGRSAISLVSFKPTDYNLFCLPLLWAPAGDKDTLCVCKHDWQRDTHTPKHVDVSVPPLKSSLDEMFIVFIFQSSSFAQNLAEGFFLSKHLVTEEFWAKGHPLLWGLNGVGGKI